MKEIKKQDTSNIFVGTYQTISNVSLVELFMEKKCNSSDRIYMSLDETFTGIVAHFDSPLFITNRPGIKRTFGGKTYVSNCTLIDLKRFDDIRSIMYNEGIIDKYEPGKASLQEMYEVFCYARNYYGLTRKPERNLVRK